MANLLLSNEIAQDIRRYTVDIVSDLGNDGKSSGLAIIRLGNNPSDIAYEKSIERYAGEVGIDIHFFTVDEDIEDDEFVELIEEVNEDEEIDGVLVFRPLPEHIEGDLLKEVLSPLKDVDGITGTSLALLYNNVLETEDEIMPSWLGAGFPPSTPEACMLILDRYGIDPAGKKAVVVGRSEVVGKPVALMLLNRDATVTICHTKTENLEEITKDADILIVATGKQESIGAEHVSPGQTVIDVGIHMKPDGKMCGDVNFDEVEPIVENITPVPGGVGGLTTALLLKHVVDASMRIFIIENELDFEEEGYDPSEPLGETGLEVKGKVIKFNRPGDDD